MPALLFARLARAARLDPVRLVVLIGLFLALYSYFAPSVLSDKSTTLPVLSPPEWAASFAPAVEGWVTEEPTGKPVAGVLLRVGQVSTESDRDGYFRFTAPQLGLVADKGSGIITGLNIAITTSEYEAWDIIGAKYYPGDTLRLYPKLNPRGRAVQSVSRQIFAYSQRRGDFKAAPKDQVSNEFAPSGVSVSLSPPASIRVYRTATGVVEVVPFRDYVKRVLPNEWVPSWSPEALKAGAMAVKSYGWYWISVGGKQVALGADVKDNVDDQVYDPNVSYASTDAAVDATFNYAITRNGALFQAQYCAGSYSANSAGDCPWPGQYMTQWGSAYHADQGRSWGWILQFYYGGSVISPQPPGGGYTGPPPTAAPAATRPPTPPPQAGFSVGQGSSRADVFQAAYDRNGGAAVLGRPVGQVRWWMQYVSEFNIVAQPFSGLDGRGNVWLVFDVLRSNDDGGYRAYLLNGDIADTYANNTPPGPEWIGPPTSDPYVADAARPSVRTQGFARGALVEGGQGAQFVPWQQSFTSWKAEYFIGSSPGTHLNPQPTLLRQPGSIREIEALRLDWQSATRVPQSLGAGPSDWTAQFTRSVNFKAGNYDFLLRADSGVRLWIDGALVLDGWGWNNLRSESYKASLAAGTHTVRVQYYSPNQGAKLELNYAPTGGTPPPPSAADRAAVRVRVQWLGRPAAPSDSWVQPLTLYLSSPGDAKVLGTYKSTTDRSGVAIYQGLPPGTYNVHVKGAHSLQTARASIRLANESTVELDMKAQVEGDTNGDNCVNVADFSFVQSMLGTHAGIAGYNAAADLNGDGAVTMSDVSLLRSGFDKCGDVSADNEFQPLAVTTAPTLAQQMSPWLKPEQLQKGLGMLLVPSTTVAKAGDVIEVRVQALTASQPVDGASFLVRYDPVQLAPVDALGRPAQAVEPGVALPAVMGNWVDTRGGLLGFASGMLQGEPPSGEFTVATLRFRVIGNAASTAIGFDRTPVGAVQLTNGGTDLLGQAAGLTLTINR